MSTHLKRVGALAAAALVISGLQVGGTTAASGTPAAAASSKQPAVPELISGSNISARSATLPKNSLATRERLVTFDGRALPAKASGQKVALSFFDNARFVAKVEHVGGNSLYKSWSGQLADDPLGTFVAVQVGETFRAAVISPKGSYSLTRASGTQSVYRAAQLSAPKHEGDDEVSVKDVPRLEKAAAKAVDLPTPTGDFNAGVETHAGAETTAPAAAPIEVTDFSLRRDPASKLDIGIVFTPQAMSASYGTLENANASAAFAVALNNQTYSNSQIGVAWNLVGTKVSKANESSDYGATLTALSKHKGKYKAIKKWRTKRHADVVHMLTGPNSQYCGLGWLNTPDSKKKYWLRPYSISSVECIDNFTVTHEVGHNYGASHDPYAVAQCTTCGGLAFKYGQGLVNLAGQWRTVMAYNQQCVDNGFNCTRLAVFSNPNLAYNGAPVGSAVQHNTRVHNKTAKRMARIKLGQIYPRPVKAKGKPKAGKRLRAVTKKKKWNPGKVKVRYQWYVNYQAVSGKKGKKQRLKLKKKWRGLPVFVQVTGRKKSYRPVLINSNIKIVK
ncbi:MAG: M12 family metallo-peptidase [Nocardioides sp.]